LDHRRRRRRRRFEGEACGNMEDRTLLDTGNRLGSGSEGSPVCGPVCS